MNTKLLQRKLQKLKEDNYSIEKQINSLPEGKLCVTKNGKYAFTVTGTVNGETSIKTVNVKVNQYSSAYKIGDYVNYTYDPVASGYKLTKEQSGYTNSSAEDGSQTSGSVRPLNNLKSVTFLPLQIRTFVLSND